MLWAPQLVRFVPGEGCGYRPIRPSNTSFSWFIVWPIPRWTHRENARLSLNHHVSYIGCSPTNECYSSDSLFYLIAGPLCAGPGLPPSSASQDQPDCPITRRGKLLLPRLERPSIPYPKS